MKATKKGFTLVELLVVLGILGVLMSVLFPAVTTIQFKSSLTAVSVRGRNLSTAIFDANTDRQKLGLSNVWPRTSAGSNTSTGDPDIADQGFNSSTDYFNELFDMDNVGDSKQWEPFVSKDALKTLYGNGVNPPAGGQRLQQDNVTWIVAANVQDEMDDIIPVLLSRNMKASDLLKEYDGKKNDKVSLGTANGAKFDTPFSNKGFVLVTKGGSVVSGDGGRYCTHQVIYNKQAFEISDEGEDIDEFTYLTPAGAEAPQ